MTAPTDRAPGRASRSEVLAAASRAEGGEGVLDAGTVRVVRTPHTHVDVVRAAAAELRRSEVWMSVDGIVALAHQEDDDTEGDLVSLPPVAAHQVCVSALGLDRSVRAASEPLIVASGFSALARDVFEGSRPDVTVTIVDWHVEGVLRRWVVLDSAGGRLVDLDAPAAPDAPLSLVPSGPMALAVALGGLVAQATAPVVGSI